MQVNLDKTKLQEYKSQTADNIKNTGFAQKGYNSILRYDTWREQKCLLSEFTHESETINEQIFSVEEWLDINELKTYVDSIVAKGATHVFLSGDVSEYHDTVLNVKIDAAKQCMVKRGEADFYNSYDCYVMTINHQNKIIWHNYKRQLEDDENAEFKELQQFIDAKKVYEKLKHKFE